MCGRTMESDKKREKAKIRELIKHFKANGNKMLKKKIMKRIFEDAMKRRTQKERKENLARIVVHNMNATEREKKNRMNSKKIIQRWGALQSEKNIRMLNGKLRSDLRRSLKKTC